MVKKSSNIFKLDPILSQGDTSWWSSATSANQQQCNASGYPSKETPCGQAYYSVLPPNLWTFRQKYWIINGRSTIRSIFNKCFSCRKRQAPAAQQKMANLPEDRITPSKPPFTYTGVDCFRPFEVRRGRTKVKRYGMIFICLALHAVHIEVVSSLHTESFIHALCRFIARRGQPEETQSDNSGNFVKRERELKKQLTNGINLRLATISFKGISSGRSTHLPVLTMAECGKDAYERFERS